MSMVLRYGATQKQRLGRSRNDSTGTTNSAAESEAVPELDQVEAMVEGVKAHGVSVFTLLHAID